MAERQDQDRAIGSGLGNLRLGMNQTASGREQHLRRRLESRFAPALLVIEDESHLHAGHQGAAGGHSHFRVTIVAEARGPRY